MGTAKRSRRASDGRTGAGMGLAANGSSGSWEVAIDETTTGTQQWFAQIEGPLVYLYFPIESPSAVDQVLRFLERHGSATDKDRTAGEDSDAGSIRLARFGRSPILLTRDDEFPDRCFLVIGPAGNPSVRLTLAGEDLRSLAAALRQARQDLADDGLL